MGDNRILRATAVVAAFAASSAAAIDVTKAADPIGESRTTGAVIARLGEVSIPICQQDEFYSHGEYLHLPVDGDGSPVSINDAVQQFTSEQRMLFSDQNILALAPALSEPELTEARGLVEPARSIEYTPSPLSSDEYSIFEVVREDEVRGPIRVAVITIEAVGNGRFGVTESATCLSAQYRDLTEFTRIIQGGRP